ncbi:MAG: hypothetical protein ACAH07_06125 [Methylophilaceae bacterium]|nr:hypothetical protein [Methyloradius sp.]
MSEKAPEYLGFFIDLKSENGGWLKWPPRLLAVKENLKLHKCVENYNNQKFIDVSLYLYLMGKDGFQEWNDSFKNLSPEQEFEAFQEEAESWLELQPEEVDSLFPDWDASPEEEAK